MKFAYASLICISLVSCSAPSEPLLVKKYTLRDQLTTNDGDPMARHEKIRRLYGAVSMEQRKARLGDYFSVHWQADTGTINEIVFNYQQGSSKVKKIYRKLPANVSAGLEEFAVIGDNYFENGRVLTWKIDLSVDGEIIASRQSYLWE